MKGKAIICLSILVLAASCAAVSQGQQADKPLPAFLETEADYYVYDQTAGHVHRPHVRKEKEFAEHPIGAITMATNNLGFREDSDTQPAKSSTRILVTGDSHIDGVVLNPESFPNQLQTMLRVEVLNGGTGHYGPQNYVGFLRKYLYLKPDTYIVVIYTGNDFLDAIAWASAAGELAIPDRPAGYYEKLQEALNISPGAIWQVFNQLYFFRAFPAFENTVLQITQAQLKQIQELCAAQQIELLVILLPTKPDVEWQSDQAKLDQIAAILELSESDRAINQRLASRLEAWLKTEGVDVINMQQHFGNGEMYWRQDYHLNIAGHRKVAEIVSAHFSPSVSRAFVPALHVRHQ